MAKFNPPFANNGERRSTTPDEQQYGIPCGPFDREMWNQLLYASQAEIGNVIKEAGIVMSDDDMTQLLQAIRILIATGRPFATLPEVIAAAIDNKVISPKTLAPAVQGGTWNYAVASGTANALTVMLNPDLTAYKAGLVINFIPSAVNTGPATLKVNSLSVLPIVMDNGQPLIGGELYAGQPATVICNADVTAFNFVSSRRTIGSGVQNFTVPGTSNFTAPVTGWYDAEVIGGGAGGGGVGSASNGSAGGGGAGGRARKRIWLTAGTVVLVTVASGGAGGGQGGQGVGGGTSSFGSHCSATGGTGGKPNPTGDGGAGGQGVGGDENTNGGSGTAGGSGNAAGGPGGAASNGGAGGGGGYGIAGSGQTPGGGGGGSGAAGANNGGAGSRGEVRVRW